MRGLIDDDRLDGSHEVRVSFRPERTAFPVPAGDISQALSTIQNQCQVWGGATSPLVPLTESGSVDAAYQRILPGSAIDRLRGLDAFELGSGRPLQPKAEPRDEPWWGLQFAPVLLDYRRQESYAVLEIVELDDDDPWQPIYAACLGLLPVDPSPELLAACYLIPELRFEDFLRIDRVRVDGDFEDLLTRLSDESRMSPRQLSMVHLAYGTAGSTALRGRPTILPEPGFANYDAGPNVVVVCSNGSLEDLALLWNLRGAKGDFRCLPLGIPVDHVNPEAVRSLASHPRIARNGIAHRRVYVTSASLSRDQLAELLGPEIDGPGSDIGVASLDEMLDLGEPGAFHRDDILVWHNGRARMTPLPPDSHSEVFDRAALSDLTRMAYDLSVRTQPFPQANDIRIEALNETFAAGRQTNSGRNPRSRSEVQAVEWPSTSLMARAVARHRDLDLVESEPGRACRILLGALSDISELGLLAHAPLLELLEVMAARQGFGWYKDRLRARGAEPDPTDAVAASSDDLPDRAFADFKRVLGNSDGAAKKWLFWAERTGLVLKGFPLQCLNCRAKQWVPVAAFAPPIICRGCGQAMAVPFGDRPIVNFTYRLSERLRRVYEQDAMGHLLVARYFDALFRGGKSGRLVGLHPGMEIRRDDASITVGEADVLMFTRDAKFIPVEVKRRASGFSPSEVGKLDALRTALASPWCAVAAMQYLGTDSADYAKLVVRSTTGATYERVGLTYDRLLEPVPTWTMGQDPFALNPMTADEIADRERNFVTRLAARGADFNTSWLEFEMLRRHQPPSQSHDD